jgi:hypothetical protein
LHRVLLHCFVLVVAHCVVAFVAVVGVTRNPLITYTTTTPTTTLHCLFMLHQILIPAVWCFLVCLFVHLTTTVGPLVGCKISSLSKDRWVQSFFISSSSSMLSCDCCWIFSTKKFSERRFDFASISFDST